MANNRIYIKCRACGKEFFLGKESGFGYYWHNYHEDGEHLEDKLNNFFDKHYFCDGCAEAQPNGIDGWPDHFEIAYEFEPCWRKGK